MDLTSEQVLDGGVVERTLVLDDVPGFLWTPVVVSAAPVPLLLLCHPGGLDQMYSRLAARAQQAAALGFAAATIELPGKGVRPPTVDAEQARVDLREAVMAGEAPGDDVIDRLILPLVDESVPEWQHLLDEVLALPEIGGPVGFSGGVIAIGVRLAVVEPRIVAAGLFAGSFIPRATLEEARRVTIPLHVLLQWDDRGNDRQAALDLFDAFGSAEKTLQANLGGHTGVPAHAGEDAARFFGRHLGGRLAALPGRQSSSSVDGVKGSLRRCAPLSPPGSGRFGGLPRSALCCDSHPSMAEVNHASSSRRRRSL